MSAIRSNANRADRSRRDFLKLCTSYLLGATAVLAAGGLLRFLDYDAQPPRKTQFDLGPPSKYAEDSRTVLPDVPAILIRAKGQFVALSLVCTHLGCTVDESPEGFSCPCHGSHYDRQGEVLRGPASQALRRLRLETDAQGNLILHTD